MALLTAVATTPAMVAFTTKVICHAICAGSILAAGHPVAHHAAHEAVAPAVEEVLQEVGLLAVHPSHHPRQVVRVFEALIPVVRVAAGEIAALLEGFLAQLPAELHALLGLQSGEGLACQVLIISFRELRSDLALAVDDFCFGDVVVRGPPIVALCEVPVLFPALARQVAQEIHPRPSVRFPSGAVFPTPSSIKQVTISS